MQQSRLESLIEVLVNIAIGFVITMAASPYIYPLFGVSFSAAQNFGLTMIFTALSVARGYVVRRFFATKLQGFSKQLAAMLRKGFK